MAQDADYWQKRYEDKDKEASQLRDFKSLVSRVVDTLYLAIIWAWVILGIASPIAIYYRPLPQDSFMQGLTVAAIFWVLFAMAHGLKAVGRLKRD